MNTLTAGIGYLDLKFQGRPHIIASAIITGTGGVAIVDPGPSSTLPELRRALADKLEHHALPVVLRAVRKLPRNENDKIDGAAVAAWLEANAVSPAVDPQAMESID